MGPRFGRLYASAVLRPLAEQMLGELAAQPGETVCDLMCDGGTLGVALGSAAGSQGHVVLVDTDSDVLDGARRAVSATGCATSTLTAAGGPSPLIESSCDRIGTLGTLGFWPGDSLLEVAERALRPDGRAVVLTWDPANPPVHEVALVDGLRDRAGISSQFLTRCLASIDPMHAARWEPLTLQDVVRFDGIEGYWAAMVIERPVAAELAGRSDHDLLAIQAACRTALEPWTAADGTMRIPVRATLWCSGRGARA